MSWMKRVVAGGHGVDAWRLAGRLRSDRLAILTYHGVSEDPAALGVLSGLHVPRDSFEAQLGYLSANHPVLPLAEALSRLAEGEPLPRGAVCITFDDGYRNNYRVAFPALRRHGLPATIFLATHFVGSGQMLWHDRVARVLQSMPPGELKLDGQVWQLTSPGDRRAAFSDLTSALKSLPEVEMLSRLAQLEDHARVGAASGPLPPDSEIMDWDEARDMKDSGLITFGSHTVTHPILSRLTPERLREELGDSRAKIEAELGVPCNLLAYPNGRPEDVTNEVVRCARECGYSHALTTELGRARPAGDPMRIPRFGVGEHTPTLAEFAFQISGARAWLMDRRNRFRRSRPARATAR
jgi:peptidoglycan/xylan/chitin deacetylase (PgdA/CDA1 family)